MIDRIRTVILVTLSFITFATLEASATRVKITELAPFDRAVECIKFYEGWHTQKSYPYIGYGHRILPGEKLSYNMTRKQGEALLRKDLRDLCKVYRSYGKDSLLLAVLSYNVGIGKVKGNNTRGKSALLRKIESGSRDIVAEYVDFCRVGGKEIPSIRRRRVMELHLLFS